MVTVVEGCQEGAQRRKAEERREETRTVEKEESGVKSLKKWLQASRRRQACMMVSREPHKVGKVFMRSWVLFTRSWRERDQMAAQWNEEQKPEEILERRRS